MMTKTSRTNRLASVFMGASAIDKKAMLWYLNSKLHMLMERREHKRWKPQMIKPIKLSQQDELLTIHLPRLLWRHLRWRSKDAGRSKPEQQRLSGTETNRSVLVWHRSPAQEILRAAAATSKVTWEQWAACNTKMKKGNSSGIPTQKVERISHQTARMKNGRVLWW